MSRFDDVSCSQCGRDFGPGDHGFSHCENHGSQIAALALNLAGAEANEHGIGPDTDGGQNPNYVPPADDADRDLTQALEERDQYHDVADKLTEAISDHLGADFGEHTSGNCPWDNAIAAIEEAPPIEQLAAAKTKCVEYWALLMERPYPGCAYLEMVAWYKKIDTLLGSSSTGDGT